MQLIKYLDMKLAEKRRLQKKTAQIKKSWDEVSRILERETEGGKRRNRKK